MGVTLWNLLTPMEFYIIGHLFGIACCTASIIVHEMCGVENLSQRGKNINIDIFDEFLKAWENPVL